jgi:3-oxoadipate enol-lactonase
MAEQLVRLAYQEQGQGSPLMLVHGFPFDHSIWDAVAGHIQSEVRVILPDLRGFGNSPSSSSAFSMMNMAGDLVMLLDHLKIEKVVLVGHSMGGYIGLAFAKAFPDRLSGLGLVASKASADTPEQKAGRYALAVEVDRKGVVAVVDANLQLYSPQTQVLKKTRKIMLQCSPQAVSAALKGMAEREDMTSVITGLDLPTLVITGEVDTIIPLEQSQALAGILKKGRLVIVPGGGHMLMLEGPELVATELKKFVHQVGQSG